MPLQPDNIPSTPHPYIMASAEELACLIRTARELASSSPGAEAAFPTDITYLKPVIDNIDSLAAIDRNGVVCWLGVLLQNPFPLRIDKEGLGKTVGFLLETAHATANRKSALRCLAMLARKADVQYHCADGPRFCIHDTEVSEPTYYEFLGHLAGLGGKVESEPIAKSDSMFVKRMKIKIMSNGPASGALEALFGMLNDSDSRLAWTLCRSFVKVARHADAEAVVQSLKKSCDVLFANEGSWINVATILGMMALEGWAIGDVSEIIWKGACYTNEFVSSSEMVRESALFLVWALVRSSQMPPERLFHLMVARALFDPSLPCRRGAAGVVLEHVGRFPRPWGEELISLINFHSVKRLSSCSRAAGRVLEMLGCSDVLEDVLLKNLFHHDLEVKRQSAYCISRHFGRGGVIASIGSAALKTPSDFIGVFAVVKEFARQGRHHEVGELVELVIGLKIDPSFCKYREFCAFVTSYLEAVESIGDVGSSDIICENLYMLLARSVLPEEVSRTSWMFIDTNRGFADRVAKSVGRATEGFILANSRNKKHEGQIRRKYLEYLDQGPIDTKAHVMKAIRLCGRVDGYEEHILEGLENYHTDSRGDMGSRLRMESLLASFSMQDGSITSRYFVRYFVGKSKALRDECILMCKSSDVFPQGFGYISRPGHLVDSARLQPIRPFLNAFYSEFRRLEEESDLGNDSMVFMASAKASKHLSGEHYNEFVNGILETIGSSSASLCSLVIEAVFGVRKRFLESILMMLQEDLQTRERMVWAAAEVACKVIDLEAERGLLVYGDNPEIANRLLALAYNESTPDRIRLLIRDVLGSLSKQEGLASSS